MSSIEKYLNFCIENDTFVMTTETALRYFRLRKNAATELLEKIKNNPFTKQKFIKYFTDEIKICNKNIKKLQ